MIDPLNANVNINISNINLFFSRISCTTDIKERVTIVRHSFLSSNEANICHKIHKIPYYNCFFSILEDFEVLNVADIQDESNEFKQLDLTKDYYLFKYNDKDAIDFTDFLYSNITSIKQLILYSIDTFQHLSRGLSILHKNNIRFFNVNPRNIVFLNDAREKPLWNNFKNSIQIAKLSADYIIQIVKTIKDFTYMPFEIHILYYIIRNPSMLTFDQEFIMNFCNEYMENMHILRLFSPVFKENYRKLCVQMVKTYLNTETKYIIQDIVERNSQCDVFGMSLIYIHIFGCIINVYSLKDTFMNKILPKLLVNLHPDSTKRYSLDETIALFKKYLDDCDSWEYVNNLDKYKITELFEEFSK